MSNITPDAIFQLASGFMAAKHLFIANEVGLFATLAEAPATLDRLADALARPRVRIWPCPGSPGAPRVPWWPVSRTGPWLPFLSGKGSVDLRHSALLESQLSDVD
jgi:hypothetical protein